MDGDKAVMNEHSTHSARTRRDFLKTAAAAPLAAASAGIALPRHSLAMHPVAVEPAAVNIGSGSPAAAHEPPYEALRRFILPGQDEFAVEQTAVEIERRLDLALSNGQALPAAENAAGQSPMPKQFRALAPDVAVAEFDAADTDWAEGWKKWVASLGKVRRWQFSALPDSEVRFEVSGEADSRVYHRVGRWRQVWVGGKLVEFRPLEEHKTTASQPWFRDVTTAAFRAM